MDRISPTPYARLSSAARRSCRPRRPPSRRYRSLQDERNVLIWLTAAGRALKTQAAEVPGQIASCVNLSLPDAMELHRILHLLLADDALAECDFE